MQRLRSLVIVAYLSDLGVQQAAALCDHYGASACRMAHLDHDKARSWSRTSEGFNRDVEKNVCKSRPVWKTQPLSNGVPMV